MSVPLRETGCPKQRETTLVAVLPVTWQSLVVAWRLWVGATDWVTATAQLQLDCYSTTVPVVVSGKRRVSYDEYCDGSTLGRKHHQKSRCNKHATQSVSVALLLYIIARLYCHIP